MAVILLAGIVCSVPKNLNPANGSLHMVFHLRAEGDGQIWRIRAKDKNEIGAERLALGDGVAVTGVLDIRAEADREGRKRIGFRVQARQILFLRGRSITKAAAMHESQSISDGFARPRID
jgi:hypothetical protein